MLSPFIAVIVFLVALLDVTLVPLVILATVTLPPKVEFTVIVEVIIFTV